jgi:hypothetical protein
MPASRGLRKRRTQAQWNALLRRFATSGLGSREFCRREGVALSSLQRWRGRLGEPSSAPGFVELTGAPAAPSEQETWTVELTLPSGVSLRVRG